jgi:hypothetical protein
MLTGCLPQRKRVPDVPAENRSVLKADRRALIVVLMILPATLNRIVSTYRKHKSTTLHLLCEALPRLTSKDWKSLISSIRPELDVMYVPGAANENKSALKPDHRVLAANPTIFPAILCPIGQRKAITRPSYASTWRSMISSHSLIPVRSLPFMTQRGARKKTSDPLFSLCLMQYVP